ncbi:unnamed protein product [Dovyalis caffra]|uniref:Uncharacterized protein n=1 Tax=Dovyalis caffra TaxID=77055 RepID=A0AAV1RLA4_9ROSI|nr:unnamed protein product [Dovyalis caffra]
MVRPAEDLPIRRLWLSNLDLIHPRFYAPTLLLYSPNGSSNFFEAKALKEALRKVLVPFYPAAGRLARDENGRIEINCNGEGVVFVEAETDSTTAELGDFVPGTEIQQLYPIVDTSGDISSCPLIVIQVTKFKCGKVCLGLGWHHTLVDGAAALHFLDTWTALARSLPITIPPFIDRTILRCQIPPKPTFPHREFDPPHTMNTPIRNSKSKSMANLMNVIPEAKLRERILLQTNAAKRMILTAAKTKGGDGGAPSERDDQYLSDDTPVVALSTGCVKAMVVNECDSTMGCHSDHDFQPPCPNNIVDASKAVWQALGVPESDGGDMDISWSDA